MFLTVVGDLSVIYIIHLSSKGVRSYVKHSGGNDKFRFIRLCASCTCLKLQIVLDLDSVEMKILIG